MKEWINVCFFGLLFAVSIGCGSSRAEAEPNNKQLPNSEFREPGRETLGGACPLSFPETGVCASITWEREQAENRAGEFTLRFWQRGAASESGPYVDPGLEVGVMLWMPAHGHGSSPVRVEPVQDSGGQVVPGMFSARNVYFVMPGAWEIWVMLKFRDKLVEKARLDWQVNH